MWLLNSSIGKKLIMSISGLFSHSVLGVPLMYEHCGSIFLVKRIT